MFGGLYRELLRLFKLSLLFFISPLFLGLEGWRHLSVEMKLDPWELSVGRAPGRHSVAGTHRSHTRQSPRPLPAGPGGASLAWSQNHELLEPCALWTPPPGMLQRFEAGRWASPAGLLCCQLKLQKLRLHLLLLSEFLLIPILGFSF